MAIGTLGFTPSKPLLIGLITFAILIAIIAYLVVRLLRERQKLNALRERPIGDRDLRVSQVDGQPSYSPPPAPAPKPQIDPVDSPPQGRRFARRVTRRGNPKQGTVRSTNTYEI